MQAFWFGTIAILWAGFFVLEGFDFGVGMLLPLVAGNESDRRVTMRSIGPVWDGNEVWLLTAGGATFAAFPEWYASVFSGFYLAFALLLVGLILRGIGVEYRGKAHTDSGRRWCDGAIVVGSFLPSLLLGVAFANFLRGVTMNAGHDMTQGFFSLLNPFALLGGLVTLTLFALHGATFLAMRTEGAVAMKATSLIQLLGPVAAGLGLIFLLWSFTIRTSPVAILVAGLVAVALVVSILYSRLGRPGLAFAGTALAALLVPVWAFAALWPDVLPSRGNAANALTIYNASSSPYTLKVMTVVALIFTPIVLAYQAWTYWVFRARVTGDIAAEGGYGSRVTTVLDKARESARQTLGTSTGAQPAPGTPPAVTEQP